MQIASLKYIQFFPTLRCNRKCGFCFNRGIPPVADISADNYRKLIEILSSLNIREIDLLGGEPTLHAEISMLIDIAFQKRLHTCISSNGSNIGVLENIRETYDKDKLTLGISINLDKISNELHNFIMNHKPLLKGICTNDKTIPDTAAYYINSGAKYFLLFLDAMSVEDMHNSLPFNDFLKRLDSIKKANQNIEGVYCSGFIQDNQAGPRRYRCPAGTTKLSILPDGNVYPCYLFFRNNEFRLGNILSDDFSAIWENPILDHFRKFEKNNCPNNRCELFSSCGGGCPAVSFAIHKDLGSPDPRCIKS